MNKRICLKCCTEIKHFLKNIILHIVSFCVQVHCATLKEHRFNSLDVAIDCVSMYHNNALYFFSFLFDTVNEDESI